MKVEEFFLGCLNVVRKPHRLLLVLLLLMLLLEFNFITRYWLDLGETFKKHLTPLIFMNFCDNFSKFFEKISKIFGKKN